MPRFLKFISKPRFPICSLCNEPVELETAKADEHGNSIHEECYVLGLIIKTASIPPRRTAIQLCPSVSPHAISPICQGEGAIESPIPERRALTGLSKGISFRMGGS
jgi:hypothetical protein